MSNLQLCFLLEHWKPHPPTRVLLVAIVWFSDVSPRSFGSRLELRENNTMFGVSLLEAGQTARGLRSNTPCEIHGAAWLVKTPNRVSLGYEDSRV